VPSQTDWQITALASVAQVAGLVLARVGRGRMGAPMLDAFAVGVLVGLLIPLVAKLISTSNVLLARTLLMLEPDARAATSSVGPIVIQNLAAGLVIVTYILALRSQRGTERPRSAPLFALGFGTYAVAEGMAAAAGTLPATASLTLALVHVCRGVALAGAPAQYAHAPRWLVAVALLAGPLGLVSLSLARGLGFDAATVVVVPLLGCAVALLVFLIGQLTGNRMRQLPPVGFIAGLGLTLAAARLVGSSFS
jgi:hypothetical protein